MARAWVMVLALALTLGGAAAGPVMLKNGGYEGIVVAIDEDVPADGCRNVLNSLEVAGEPRYRDVVRRRVERFATPATAARRRFWSGRIGSGRSSEGKRLDSWLRKVPLVVSERIGLLGITEESFE
ncbi:Uncharacterized protein GBIM_04671 [Gryllus bimaculatus]|nr:Uncharacterized protein GBIM_04671 [Gryllus bimaculatus]